MAKGAATIMIIFEKCSAVIPYNVGDVILQESGGVFLLWFWHWQNRVNRPLYTNTVSSWPYLKVHVLAFSKFTIYSKWGLDYRRLKIIITAGGVALSKISPQMVKCPTFRPISSYKPLWDKCPNDPNITLKTKRSKVPHIQVITTCESQNFTPFCSTASRFGVTGQNRRI